MPTTHLTPGKPSATARFSLALSGGGVRAMAVHFGVLRYLAEHGWLERIARVSSVSGGSLAVGLVVAQAGRVWPSSEAFLNTVLPASRACMCERHLLWDALSQLKNPANWQYLLSRANLLGKALKDDWGFDFPLQELPKTPSWTINATTAENGKRFRFKRTSIGDYEAGYADSGDVSLSTALAVSAAFPGAIGPLAFPTAHFQWKKRMWGEPRKAARQIEPEFKTLHLYDGGVYDNLGLEPLFDAGRVSPKIAGDIIIVSDAGAPLGQGFSRGLLNPWRLKRVADIMSDQTRSLRARTFVEYIRRTRAGAFIGIDSSLIDQTADTAAYFTCRFPTTLRRLQESEFDTLAEHGYTVTKRVHETYGLGVE